MTLGTGRSSPRHNQTKPPLDWPGEQFTLFFTRVTISYKSGVRLGTREGLRLYLFEHCFQGKLKKYIYHVIKLEIVEVLSIYSIETMTIGIFQQRYRSFVDRLVL